MNALTNCDDDHTLRCSSDMVCDRCSFYFSFWAITPLPNNLKKKSKLKKIKKTPGDISSFYTCVLKIIIT